MAEQTGGSVPPGAAVLPEIPAGLGVHPLLLAVLHAAVFLEGSEDTIVQPDAALEALEYMASYLQRLEGEQLERLKEDLATLAAFARQEDWPKAEQRFFKDFLANYGIGGEESV